MSTDRALSSVHASWPEFEGFLDNGIDRLRGVAVGKPGRAVPAVPVWPVASGVASASIWHWPLLCGGGDLQQKAAEYAYSSTLPAPLGLDVGAN